MGRLSIGWASRDVSTTAPINIPGQFHMRISKGILDPVTTTALVVDGGDDLAIFLSLDAVVIRAHLLDEVREEVRKRNPEIPAEKILMGVPNYGYDWPLPFERGVTEARTIGNVEAVLLAAEYYAEIRFDETAQTAQGFITVNLQRNKAEILDRQGNMC